MGGHILNFIPAVKQHTTYINQKEINNIVITQQRNIPTSGMFELSFLLRLPCLTSRKRLTWIRDPNTKLSAKWCSVTLQMGLFTKAH